MRKFTAAIVCLLVVFAAFGFGCNDTPEEHIHTPTVETEVQGINVVEVTSCSECHEIISETTVARYLAKDILLDAVDTSKVTIESAEGLINFSAVMNSTYEEPEGYVALNKKVFANKTLYLGADIDLSGTMWTPINLDNASIDLTLDGQGHTITGLTLNGSTDIGFVGLLQKNLTVKNLNFDSAKLTTTGRWCGFLVGHQESGTLTVENVNFTNCKLWGTVIPYSIRLGCIVGYCNLEGCSIDVKNCSVDSSEFYGYHNTCALIGTLAGAQAHEDRWSITGCSVTDNKFYIGTSTPMYVNPFTVDTTYMERDAMEQYIEERDNTQENNTFEYGVTQNPFTPDL